jgi:hypothetical protein
MVDDWTRIRDTHFWSWLFGGDFLVPIEESLDLEFCSANNHGLRLLVNIGTSATLLDLETHAELGWIDDAHFHPNCLRVDELLCVSKLQDTFEKRASTLLLLLPFAVATCEVDFQKLSVAVQLAWRQLGFDGECPGLENSKFIDALVEWSLDDRGNWYLRQTCNDLSVRSLYSLRLVSNLNFPRWLSEI